jgi:hypothetical protein
LDADRVLPGFAISLRIQCAMSKLRRGWAISTHPAQSRRRAIANYPRVATLARASHGLAARTYVSVGVAVVGEVVARERAIGLRAAVKDRNMRFDLPLNQLGEIATGAVRGAIPHLRSQRLQKG